MRFEEKYTTANLSSIEGEDKKTMISAESFVVCEMLQKLIDMISKRGMKW